jgi:dihydropteroate synthase
MTKLAGIVNVTPDSFSDGGQYTDTHSALAHIEQLIEDGADIIDIGAESTRPGATALSAEQEWERLSPLFEGLNVSGAIFSLDTRHAENARRALDIGFHWINDVSGFKDNAMIETVKLYGCQLVMMHSLTVPADKNVTLPEDADVIDALLKWSQANVARLERAGIRRHRIIMDPGLGFGKTARQSGQIIERFIELKACKLPILIGHSRKSFLGAGDRDAGTLAVSRQLIAKGVDYLRVHDVAAHVELLERNYG